MSKTFALLFLLMCFIHPICVQAQKNLQGELLDKQSDEPIPFASVKLLHQEIGVLTDSLGHFSLSYINDESDTLQISSVGYSTLNIPLSAFRDSGFVTIHITVLPPTIGAVVKVKYNRALWFWRKIIQHKP